MIWNETVNAARLGLRCAIQGVQEFDASLTDQQALLLLMTVADVEGVPPHAAALSHNSKLYDEVRRRLDR